MNEIVEKLNEYVDKRLLRKSVDEKTGLVIYDYTEHCTYENAWDEITMNHRSTIRDKEGNLVVQGMRKFFNYFQLSPEKQKEVAKWDFSKCRISQKYDGCLTTIFPYNGYLMITSKCTWDNYVVDCVKEIIKDKLFVNMLEDTSLVLICEVIHPKTRQIVNYGDLKELRVIAGVNMATGQEYDYEHTKSILDIINADNIKMVEQKEFTFDQLIKWQKTNNWEQEGFVVQNLETKERVKFKSEDYLRVAAIKSNINIVHLVNTALLHPDNWQETLIDMVQGLPDEFQKEAKVLIDELIKRYKKIYNDIKNQYEQTKNMTDKELGLSNNQYKGYIFSLRKGKTINKEVLKLLKEDLS